MSVSCYRETALPLSPVVATQVTNDNIDTMPNGVEATGVVGDYALYNNYVQLIVQGNTWNQNYNMYEPFSGGAIVDAVTRTTGSSREQISKNDDGVRLIRQGVNLSSGTVIGYDSITVHQEDQVDARLIMKGRVYDLDGSLAQQGASIAADGTVNGVQVETEIYLTASIETETTTNAPVRYFNLTTVVSNNGSETVPIFTVHDSVLYGPYVYDAFIPYPKWGFEKPELDQSPSSTGFAYPPYATFQSRQDSTNNFFFTPQTDGLFSANREVSDVGERVMVGKFFQGQQGLAPGGQLTFLREWHYYVRDTQPYLLYGQLLDFLKESLPDTSIYRETGTLGVNTDFNNSPGGMFQIEHIGSEISWFDGQGYQPTSMEMSFPVFGTRRLSNAYTIEVPVGTYQFQLDVTGGSPQFFSVTEQTDVDENGDEVVVETPAVVVSDETFIFGDLEAGDGYATVRVEGQTADEVKQLYRYTVIPTDGAEYPELGPIPSSSSANTLYSSKFKPNLVLPRGQFDVLISHGPLFNVNVIQETVEETEYTNEFGQTSVLFRASESDVTAELGQSLNLPNYFAADFGLVSALDEDGLDNPASLMTFAEGEDLDVVFLLDSNRITDGPTFLRGQSSILGNFVDQGDGVEEEDLQDRIVAAYAYSTRGVATDAFPFGKGQFGILGIAEEQLTDHPPILTSDPATLYDEVREQFPESLILLRTPRAPVATKRALFSAISAMLGLDPAQPLPADNAFFTMQSGSGSTTTWLDFDLIQLLEGNSYEAYLKARGDWFELLNAGIFKPAVGGSQVGSTANLSVGTVRTYVAVSDTTHMDNDLVEFWEAVREGRMFLTNGPIVEAQIGSATFGQSTSGSSQTTMDLTVSASPWIPVDSIRIFVDGHLVQTLAPQSQNTVRYDGTVTLDLAPGSHWVVVEAGTNLETHVMGTPAGTFSNVYRNHTPIALANPIFVQVN